MDELDRALLHPLVTGTKRMDAAYPISVPKSPIPKSLAPRSMIPNTNLRTLN